MTPDFHCSPSSFGKKVHKANLSAEEQHQTLHFFSGQVFNAKICSKNKLFVYSRPQVPALVSGMEVFSDIFCRQRFSPKFYESQSHVSHLASLMNKRILGNSATPRTSNSSLVHFIIWARKV